MPKGPYQDVQLKDFAGGLNTRIEVNKLNDNESPDLLNVTFDGAGSFQPRYGQELFGTRSSASGKIRTTWTTQNIRGEEMAIRQVDNNTTSWFEYYNIQTAAWEILTDGYTTGYDFGHASYDYYTYYCSQKDFQRRWNGIAWRVSTPSTITAGATSAIDLSTSAASALGFLSASGELMIDGEAVYYSSSSGVTLKGITFVSNHTSGCAIAQRPVSTVGYHPLESDAGWVSATSSLPHGSMMYEMDAQMFVAGLSSSLSAWNGNVVLYSAVDEPKNYALSAKPACGGSARYPETLGPITAINSFDDVLMVLKENTVRQLKFNSLADGTAGSLEIVARNEVTSSPKTGAANNKSTVRVENSLVYVSPAGWVKSISKDGAGRFVGELSVKIRPTVEGLNMLSAAATYFDGKYYLACAEGETIINNVVYVWDYDFRAWTKFNNWNVGDWFTYNNELYYGACNEVATYKALTGFADDSLAYETYWTSKQMDFGIPNEEKRLNMVYVEGYITQNSELNVSAYFNNNTSNPYKKSISGTGSYIDNTDEVTLIGGVVWGKGVYGGSSGGSAYNLNKFRVWLKFAGQTFHVMQLKLGTSSPSYIYKVTNIVPYVQKIDGKRIPIESII
jgi:hypothetical protein